MRLACGNTQTPRRSLPASALYRPVALHPNRPDARSFPALALLAFAVFAPRASAQQPIDSTYSVQIRELTPTDPHWKFTTELVSTLPASASVPTPLKVLGYVPGSLGHLSYVADLNRYLDALAGAAPNRVKKFSLGKSEEGRESI